MTTYIDNSIYLLNPADKVTTHPITLTASSVSLPVPIIDNSKGSSSATSTPPKTQTAPKVRDIDKKALIKQYKDNPMGVINELGLEFTPQEYKQLQNLLKDKRSLEQFLNIVDKANLTDQDLIGALEHESKRKKSWFGRRLWTLLTKGRSEHEIHADNFSREMSEVRESRQDLSTNTVVSVADANETTPENKENVMHFVEAKRTNGTPIYSEDNVTSAVGYIQEHPDNADELVSVTTELENITDENGVPKYTGTTMLNVGIRSAENPKLKDTNLRVAHKSDMTDEYLENITGNLFENPDMQGVINFSLDVKTQDGSDKFSACNINDESNQLVHQELDYCNSYLENLQTLSQYGNLSSDDIVTITQNITAHPEIYNDVISKINSGTLSGSEIAEYSTQCAIDVQNGTYISQNNYSGNDITSTLNLNSNSNSDTHSETTISENESAINRGYTNVNQNNKLNSILNICEITDEDDTNNSNTIEILGRHYDKDKLEAELYKRYGTISNRLLKQIIANPNFIETINQYSGNKVILEALLNNPDLINKINSAAGALTNKERVEIINLCTDSSSTNIMLAALSVGSVTDAIRTTKLAKITNAKDDTFEILTSNNKSNSNKKMELRQLYGINDKCNFTA